MTQIAWEPGWPRWSRIQYFDFQLHLWYFCKQNTLANTDNWGIVHFKETFTVMVKKAYDFKSRRGSVLQGLWWLMLTSLSRPSMELFSGHWEISGYVWAIETSLSFVDWEYINKRLSVLEILLGTWWSHTILRQTWHRKKSFLIAFTSWTSCPSNISFCHHGDG